MTSAQREITGRTGKKRDERLSDNLLDSLSKVMHHWSLLPSGVFQLSPAGNLIFVNEEWYGLSGIEPEKCLNKKWYELFIPADRILIKREWTKSRKQRKPFLFEARFDGTHNNWISGKVVPVTEIQNVTGFIGSIHPLFGSGNVHSNRESSASFHPAVNTVKEISELREQEKQQRIFIAGLEAQLEYKEKLFSVLTHEIKNQFFGITGLSELLHTEMSRFSSDEIKRLAAKIFENSTEVNHVLSNLLELHRLESGKIQFSGTKVYIKEHCKNFWQQIDSELANRNIKLTVKLSSKTAVYGDPYMLQSIFRHLIYFCSKYSIKVSDIEVQDNEKPGFAEFRVSGNGRGVKKETLKRFFSGTDPGIRVTDNDEVFKKMELLIAKEFIKIHGGTITAESKFNEGLSFVFTIPKK